MKKYLFVVCALLVVVAGCSGGSAAPDSIANDDSAVTDNRFGWSGAGSDEAGDVADESDTVTTVEEEPAVKTVKVSISGTVPEDIMKGRELSESMTAAGGSGNYEWEIESVASSTYSFPEWIHLSADTGEVINIISEKATEGKFKFKVKVCDAEKKSNCKSKTFKVTVDSIKNPGVTGTISNCRGEKPVISEVVTTGIPALDEAAVTSIGYFNSPLNRKFKAVGGFGPYTWIFKMESEDEFYRCEYNADADCAAPFRDSSWDESSVDEDDPSIFNVTGSFMHGVPYCDGVQDADGQCDGKFSLRDAVKLQVQDSCGTVSDIKQYNFSINSPDDKIGEIFIETRLKGYNLDEGEQNMRFELIGLDDSGEERVLAKTKNFSPQNDYDTYAQRFMVEPDVNSSLIHSRMTKIRVHLWEQAGCDSKFKVNITRVKVSGRYWYIERDANKEVEVNYESNCSKDPRTRNADLITFSDAGTEWLRYFYPLSEDDITISKLRSTN